MKETLRRYMIISGWGMFLFYCKSGIGADAYPFFSFWFGNINGSEHSWIFNVAGYLRLIAYASIYADMLC